MNSAHVPVSGLKSEEVKRRHILPKALVVGITAGLIASLFRRALQASETSRFALLHRLSGFERFAAAVGIAAVGGAAGLWLVRRFAPETAGSGIPHLKSVVDGETELRWKRVIPVKFLAGVVGVGGGLTLGREGPTVQMGGATGLMVSRWFRVKPGEGERRALISSGAAAGVAAAFNAPLAGLIFALEELNGNFTPVVFVASFLASVTADVVCRIASGEAPVFAMHGVPVPTLRTLPYAIVIGLLSGLVGVLFNRCLLGSLDAFDRLRRLPPLALGAVAGAVVGFSAWVYPEVSGSGSTLSDYAVDGGFAVGTLAILLVARFALTMVSYGCGAAGGIFAPLLVLGSLGGVLVANAARGIIPGWDANPATLAVIGMGSLFTGIVRAPLTGIVLMIELTGSYEFTLPLLVGGFSAYGVAEMLRDMPIYEALRERSARLAAVNNPT